MVSVPCTDWYSMILAFHKDIQSPGDKVNLPAGDLGTSQTLR